MAVAYQNDEIIKDQIIEALDKAQNDALEIPELVSSVARTCGRDSEEVKRALWDLIRHDHLRLTVDLQVQLIDSPDHALS